MIKEMDGVCARVGGSGGGWEKAEACFLMNKYTNTNNIIQNTTGIEIINAS